MGKQIGETGTDKKTFIRITGIYRAVLYACIFIYLLIAAAPAVFGFRPYIVLSGSMEPTVRTGALAYIDCGGTDVHTGDIVAYSLKSDVTVIHRIVDEPEEGVFITKGDGNSAADFSPVSSSMVVGKMAFSVPYMGRITCFIRSGKGMVLCLCAISAAVVSSVISDLYESGKTKEKENDNQ